MKITFFLLFFVVLSNEVRSETLEVAQCKDHCSKYFEDNEQAENMIKMCQIVGCGGKNYNILENND